MISGRLRLRAPFRFVRLDRRRVESEEEDLDDASELLVVELLDRADLD